jgi:hypothetical protein
MTASISMVIEGLSFVCVGLAGDTIMLLENWTKICQCRREKWNDAKTETEAIYRRI